MLLNIKQCQKVIEFFSSEAQSKLATIIDLKNQIQEIDKSMKVSTVSTIQNTAANKEGRVVLTDVQKATEKLRHATSEEKCYASAINATNKRSKSCSKIYSNNKFRKRDFI